MISRISGKILKQKGLYLTMEVSGCTCPYRVMIPVVLMKGIEETKSKDAFIALEICHRIERKRLLFFWFKTVSVIVGFLNKADKDFFEKFMDSAGIGMESACKSLVVSFSAIAEAIDKGDKALLKTLPGISEQKIGVIIAKLQGKLGKYWQSKAQQQEV